MRRASICLILLVAVPAEASPASDRVLALMRAYNLGTDAAMLAYVAENYPQALDVRRRERVAAYWRAVYREFGPVRVHSTLTDKDNTAEIIFRATAAEAWVSFEISVSAEPPHYVSGAGVGRGIEPGDRKPDKSLPESQVVTKIARYAQGLDRAGVFSGAFMVARNGRVIASHASGLADREHGIPNRLGTRFNIASLSKMFTAVAVLQLVEAGTIALDDPLAKFIPEYPKPIAERVTIRHLLTHTSGIELDDDKDYNAEAQKTRSVEALLKVHLKYVPKLKNFEAFVPPGSFDYTNEGYDLLGVILERVTKKSFHDVLATSVFARAGMTSTVGYDIETIIPNAAEGYCMREGATGAYVLGAPRKNTLWLSYATTPAGDHFSTAGDLIRFADALQRHKLMGTKMTELATSTPGPGYGHGFEIHRAHDVLSIGHSGGLPGASARLDIYPARGYEVVVLSNESWQANNVADRIRELLSGLP